MLLVSSIRVDEATQSRVTICEQTVMDYAAAWQVEASFPPIEVFQSDDGHLFVGDGFHRLLGAKRAQLLSIASRVHKGTARDAFLFACTANHTHGLRRTNSDKRHMVRRFLDDNEWVKWSDRRIADQCGVSHPFVSEMRREMVTVTTSPAAESLYEPREGLDGKHRAPNGRSTTALDSGTAVCEPPLRVDHMRKIVAALQELEQLLRAAGKYDGHAADALRLIAREVCHLSSPSEPFGSTDI
jgi:hypothetical protein